MFWGDKIVEQIKKEYQKKIESGQPLVIRDEKTMSGRVHVGSLRGVAIHGIISEILSEKKIANKYLFHNNLSNSLELGSFLAAISPPGVFLSMGWTKSGAIP